MANREVQLISAVCKNKDLASILSEDITPLFRSYGDVWNEILTYWRKYRSTPPMDVVLEKYPNFMPIPVEAETEFYLNELRNDFASSSLNSLMLDWAKKIDRGQSGLEILQEMSNEVTKLSRLSAVVKDVDVISEYEERIRYMQDIRQKNEDGLGVTGIPTNINAIDMNFGGLQPGDLVVLMGWTGSMKSFFACKLGVEAWKRGYKVLYLSLEMQAMQLAARIDTLLGEGEFSNVDLMNGRVDFDDFNNWATNTYKDKSGFIIVSNEGLDGITPDTVSAKIEQHHPDLVILDYHQLFDDVQGARNETERNKNISKAFKRMALKYNIPVVDITAVTMETGQQGQRAPMLAEVAWSKQIAYDADLVLAVHREDNLFQGISRKVRRGEHFAFQLEWDVDSGVVKEFYERIE